MFEGHDHAVFEIVTAHQLVAPLALQAAWEQAEKTNTSLALVLLQQGLLEKTTLLPAIAAHIGFDYADKLPESLPREAMASVEGSMARAYSVAPVASDAHSVTLLTAHPFNPHLVNDLTFALKKEVHFALADPERVRMLIRQHYGEESTSLDSALVELKEHGGETDAAAALSEADIEQLAGQTPVVQFVNLVLAQAIREKASDIHFEPFAQEFKIRCRVDGVLREIAPPPRHLALPVISRLKVLANLNIAERRIPQDGRIKLNVGGRAVDLRISTLPTQCGESVVLRVLDQSSGHLEIGQIGLPATIQSDVEEIIHRPNGIFLVTGPTGSGKTTTLYSCLKTLNRIDSKLLTVEDPVEYEIEGIMQVPVNPGAGLTFARALRTFLRQDPDIVMVGEIRDLETAQIAIQASLTGHLVLSTLHTNDAAGAVTRLVDMGIEPFLLASTLEGVLAQRLLRRICTSCKTELEPTAELLQQLGFRSDEFGEGKCYHGTGCAGCKHTGYRGRVGLFEFLRLSDPLRELVVQRASLVELRQSAVAAGMRTLRAAGVEAIFAGETTLHEVAKYT